MTTFNENKSIYLQIADLICDRILSHTLKENERVPSIRETAAEVEVNINTVMRSYEFLQREGIISTQRGLGYFVNEGAESIIRLKRRRVLLEETLPDIAHKATTLGITTDEIIKAFTKISTFNS